MKNIFEILLITLNKKKIGINLSEVREVIPYAKYFYIPHIPNIYLGLVNIRGEIWMLSDLKKILFKQSSTIDSRKNKILITKYEDDRIAFLVDKVEDIIDLTKGEINKIKREGKGKECFFGEIYYKNKIIPIINIKKIISKEIEEIEELDLNYFIE